MPIKNMIVKSTSKKNLGKNIKTDVYYWKENNELVGVAVGHFAPFTGKFGHARMLENAKKAGIKKVFICKENEHDYEKLKISNPELFDKNFEIEIISHIVEIVSNPNVLENININDFETDIYREYKKN